MKKKIVLAAVFILTALCLAMAVSKPDRDKHLDALTELGTKVMQSQFEEDSFGSLLMGFINSDKIIRPVLDQKLIINDYGIVNVGFLELEEKNQIISFGVFGKVFTASVEQVNAALEENGGIDSLMPDSLF